MSAQNRSYSIAFTVSQTPQQVFAAINNVRGWWSGDIVGSTNKLGDEFSYRYQDFHYSKHKITELIPSKKVVWLVLFAVWRGQVICGASAITSRGSKRFKRAVKLPQGEGAVQNN